ncbi:hypothetical protein QCA50_020752 [Cerrena zonata]|uniref:Maturase K n=1 Tax=Cerrena zonata TaxID=2478898 RepID=A0AAW0F7R2_9APHY
MRVTLDHIYRILQWIGEKKYLVGNAGRRKCYGRLIVHALTRHFKNYSHCVPYLRSQIPSGASRYLSARCVARSSWFV